MVPTMPLPSSPPSVLDEQLQHAVLHHLLLSYPAWHAVDEVARALHDPASGDGGRDDVLRALRDLAGDGLVHVRHGFVLPTRAAVRCSDLLADAAVSA
jgi:hypothetical protein